MRYRITDLAFRRSVAAAALLAGAVSLAGCSSLGSRSYIDPNVTGSTGSAGQTVGTAADQSMPAPLSNSQLSGTGPYLPPADIGPKPVAPVYTAGVAPSGAVSTNTAVTSQPLPPLISSGSQTNMSAQSAVQVATAPAAPQTSAQTASATPSSSPVGPVHRVASGESLYVIARKYGVTPEAIVTANKLDSMDKIYVGQKLVIPGGKVATAPVQTASISTKRPPVPASAGPRIMVVSTSPAPIETTTASVPVKPAAANGKFRWPVSGTVITDFADSRSGINIAALEGTAVRAAEGGQVIYTGSAVEDFGNLILIKHDNGYVTAYAHLKDITVAKGETIDRGDAIGSIGMTGGVSRPQLHFELRKGATPVDPMPLLAG